MLINSNGKTTIPKASAAVTTAAIQADGTMQQIPETIVYNLHLQVYIRNKATCGAMKLVDDEAVLARQA
eukprot:2129086-Amphidinium_carterae.1